MTRAIRRFAISLLVAVVMLPSCDASGENGGEETVLGTRACDGTPMSSSEIKLPADFPIPPEAVLTSADTVGPSSITEGFFEGDIREAYDEWRRAMEDADYDILFDEIEERDSEISYKSANGNSTGQIALRSECKDSGKIFVHITNRPS